MRKVIIALSTVALLGCSSPEIVGGSSSETTNGIIVVASRGTVSGKVKTGSTVMVFNTEYNPYTEYGFTREVVVTDGGDFSFQVPSENSYNVIAYSESNQSLFVKDIAVTENYTSEYRSLFSNSGTLEVTTDTNDVDSEYPLYIEGTPFIDMAEKKAAGLYFSIENMPAGAYNLLIRGKVSKPDGPDMGPNTGDEFTIFSDSTTQIKG